MFSFRCRRKSSRIMLPEQYSNNIETIEEVETLTGQFCLFNKCIDTTETKERFPNHNFVPLEKFYSFHALSV